MGDHWQSGLGICTFHLGFGLVGMVSQRRFSKLATFPPKPGAVDVENADLIEVVPMEVIDETVQKAMRNNN